MFSSPSGERGNRHQGPAGPGSSNGGSFASPIPPSNRRTLQVLLHCLFSPASRSSKGFLVSSRILAPKGAGPGASSSPFFLSCWLSKAVPAEAGPVIAASSLHLWSRPFRAAQRAASSLLHWEGLCPSQTLPQSSDPVGILLHWLWAVPGALLHSSGCGSRLLASLASQGGGTGSLALPRLQSLAPFVGSGPIRDGTGPKRSSAQFHLLARPLAGRHLELRLPLCGSLQRSSLHLARLSEERRPSVLLPVTDLR